MPYKEIPAAVIEELELVRQSGEANMLDFDGVRSIAIQEEYLELEDWMYNLSDSERRVLYPLALTMIGGGFDE